MRYHFDRYTLDLDTFELLDDGRRREVEPRTFAVLAHLLRHRDRVVTKEELLDEVWGDRFVSESALTTRIKHGRKALGDDGRSQRVIRTVPRVGYRFVAPVRSVAGPSEPTESVEPSGPAERTGGEAVGPGAPAPAPEDKPLFGRDDDLAELVERLSDHRMVTVTGPGGIGKTALCSLLLASPQAAALGEGWLASLANAREASTLPNVVLAAMGEREHQDADPVESALRFLERRRALLVLDGCEHVADAAASFVGRVLGRCPDVRVVATSRVPLDVEGESVVPLRPLPLDDAVACLVARARDAGASLTASDPAVSELCARLDRMPLALELAAARARLLGPRDMVELLGDRFRLLHSEGAGDDERHRSLRDAIAWSWDALKAEDQHLLARLSVFVDDCSLEDVVGVVGGDALDVVDGLERLVRSSLLQATTGPFGRRRFRLLESVRDFGAAQLADPDAVRRRHAAHFAALAEQLDEACQSEAVDEALAVMGAAWDNLRAAVEYASEAGDTTTVRRIVRGVGAYADLYQVYEVLDWCSRAELEAPVTGGHGAGRDARDADDTALFADALAVRARLLAHRGDQERAAALAAEARALHESHATELARVWCAYYGGDLEQVVEGASRLDLLSRGDRGLERAYAEGFQAIVAAVRQVAELEVTTVEPRDAERGILGALDCLTAGLRLCTADPERAGELLEAVVVSGVRHDYRLLLGAAASTLTQITLPMRPPAEAMRTLRRTLGLYRDRSMWVLISADTVMAAKLLADAGERETASRLLGARHASGYRTGLSEVLRGLLEDELRTELGDRFHDLAAQGAVWNPPEAADVAIAALDRRLDEAG